MPAIFTTLEKVRPFFDAAHRVFLFLCKVFIIVDVLIATAVVAQRFIPFIPSMSWSEEIILTCMSYMAVLSAAIAIRKKQHIRMTALDTYLPKKLVKSLDVLADLAVLILALVMLIVGWRFAQTIGSRGFYISMPFLSRFWMYFPIPLAGIAMIIFQIEVLCDDIKAFYIPDEEVSAR